LAPIEHKPTNQNNEKLIEKLENQIIEFEKEIERIELVMAGLASESKFEELKNLETQRHAVQVKLEETTAEWELLIG
jgi:predicted nuclease with TOPRIM domain